MHIADVTQVKQQAIAYLWGQDWLVTGSTFRCKDPGKVRWKEKLLKTFLNLTEKKTEL